MASSRSERRLEVRVVDAQGSPLAGCTVVTWLADTDEVNERTTDARGLASFSSLAADGGIAAISPTGLRAYRSPIRLDGSQEIVLGGSASVGGVVLVDGQPSAPGVQLTLRTEWPAAPDDAPESVRAAGIDPTTFAVTSTRVNGTFEFAGLPSDWRGTLMPPPTHWIAGLSNRASLQARSMVAPDSRIVLELTHLPTVRGRVVWKDTRLPITNAQVLVVAQCADGSRAGGSAATDADGAFQLGLTPSQGGHEAHWLDAAQRPPLRELQITCAGVPGSEGAVSVRVPWSDAQDPLVVELVRAPRMHFTAEAKDGTPLEGAVVDAEECTPTDARGHGSYRGPSPKWIGAPECSVGPAVSQSGDGSESNPLCYVLAARNAIRFRVLGVAPSHASSCRVVVASRVPLVAGGVRWRAPFHGRFGSGGWEGGSERIALPSGEMQERLVLDAMLNSALECELDSLQPGVDCMASLRDPLGIVLAEAEVLTPPFGETIEVELKAQKAMRQIYGVATGPGDEPVPKAVVILDRDGASTFCLTRADGRFRLVTAGSGEASLRVEKPGHVTAVIPLDLEREAPVHVRLARGRSVTVRVVDETGTPVDLVAEPVGFERQQQQHLGVGAAAWPDLPETVEFHLRLQGRVFRATCGPSTDEVAIVVPRLGALRVVHGATAAERGLDESICYVELARVDEPLSSKVRVKFGPGDISVKHLIPGDYRASLVVARAGTPGVGEQVLPTGIQTAVRIEAGAETELRF